MSTFKFLRHAVAAAVVYFGAMQGAQALDSVVAPTLPVAGKTQLELSQQWWQWALSIPASRNPITDTTGEFANTDNYGPVFFIAGTTGFSVVRTFKVPAGKPIFFPIINAVDVEVPGTCDLTCAFSFIDYVNSAADLEATLDGHSLITPPTDQNSPTRQTSTSFFTVKLPVDNVFGAPAPYVGALDAIADGYWVALDGLSPGQHTLFFNGRFSSIGLGEGVTVHITAISKEQCKHEGWREFGFKNQGQCVQFANTGR